MGVSKVAHLSKMAGTTSALPGDGARWRAHYETEFSATLACWHYVT